MNLIKCLDQHNRGHGGKQTSDQELRPWALVAYVAGFDGDFEIRWQLAWYQE